LLTVLRQVPPDESGADGRVPARDGAVQGSAAQSEAHRSSWSLQDASEIHLQVKHFELSDAQKFEEVWRMKEQDVQELLSVLLTADKVISEQQLGRFWFPPSHDALQKTFEQGKKKALAAGKKRTDPGVGEDDLLQLTAASNERVQEVLVARSAASPSGFCHHI
jgi:hypothetical protein